MECRQCQGIENTFTPKLTSREFRTYPGRGPEKNADIPVDAPLEYTNALLALSEMSSCPKSLLYSCE